jgi:hypothetical protein
LARLVGGLVVVDFAIFACLALFVNIAAAVYFTLAHWVLLSVFDVRVVKPRHTKLRLRNRSAWRNAVWLLELLLVAGFSVVVFRAGRISLLEVFS